MEKQHYSSREQKTQGDRFFKHFEAKIKPLLSKIYSDPIVEQLLTQIYALIQEHLADSLAENLNKWSQNEVLMITYGDSVYTAEEKSLVTLARFLEHLQDTITGVHILPFCPYSSDDGFSVIDYLQVDPELGDWQDIEKIAEKFDLMADLVLNHISSQSEWFEQFKQGIKPGCDYFIEADPATDLSAVVRPRSSPLLVEIDTTAGKKYVWATFSADQVDLDYTNPDVLLEIINIILFYIQKGAKYIRLDAVGFLWKQEGTSCIHLPQTHALIKLFREITQMINPDTALITETNVPNRENLSYFGNRDEAHLIYNFSLPPLLVNALLQGKSDHLKTWMMSMPPAPLGCAYFNFTASHDGIGLRPTEGLLLEDEYNAMLETMEQFGGKISMRSKPDGTQSPYEINISLFDALKGTVKGKDEWQIERFLCSQTIMMAVEGVPAFYIHSLLATPNDYEGMAKTGRNRSINRYKWDYEELKQKLNNPNSNQTIVMGEMSRRIQIRRRQPAFHPNATQYTLHPMNKALFAFWRQSIHRDQSIFCISNLSDRSQELLLSDINLICIDPWQDLLSGGVIQDINDSLTLQPYQCAWITNKFDI
ncbi:alpha-glucosidase C-terminal domain-containing protein [Waterburya agarophytonicola K14]|uniref:Alpha-glucosidase C-terminal domain-containing protein n=1 Tax=Waterburya agarophytonicola KI4 TaxID=2874699 RepID=A0A964BU77_9CYAN|nr:alpha-amylase family glycosyl hydrolase [Waterburya agarophytonicola]MCC0178792.1 alpha-glucosidase C-terminal domain-containing protein [Waterburya agarophytonicola KI4]